MLSLSVALLSGALSALALPASAGECKPLSSLSFAYPPSVASGLSAHVIFNGLTEPRGLRFDGKQNLLVVERLKGVTALSFRNDSTCVGWEKRTVISQPDLEHGIEIGPGKGRNQYLYASSMESVFRWEYDPTNAAVIGEPIVIAYNMSNSDHVTRTLLLQPGPGGVPKYIIVSRGSASNFDESSADVNAGPAQIRRFPLDGARPAQGYAWTQGELLAWGVRNGVGIALSKDGNDLWEIENSSDNLFWRGVDVHVDNPAEELNRISLRSPSSIPVERKFYGYPSCFTAWNASSVPVNASAPVFNFETGAQFSRRDPPTMPDDAWCANPKNVIKPVLSFQAHSAPLDLVFYDNSKCSPRSNPYGLTGKWDGDAFSSFHGSWNRSPPTGYKVVRIPWANNGPRAPSNSRNGYETIVGAPDMSKCPSGCIRPVGLAFDLLGRLFVASDETGEVFVVQNSS